MKYALSNANNSQISFCQFFPHHIAGYCAMLRNKVSYTLEHNIRLHVRAVFRAISCWIGLAIFNPKIVPARSKKFRHVVTIFHAIQCRKGLQISFSYGFCTIAQFTAIRRESARSSAAKDAQISSSESMVWPLIFHEFHYATSSHNNQRYPLL